MFESALVVYAAPVDPYTSDTTGRAVFRIRRLSPAFIAAPVSAQRKPVP